MYVLLGQSQVIQKVGLIGQPQWELDSMFSYTKKVELSLPLQTHWPTLAVPIAGGRGIRA